MSQRPVDPASRLEHWEGVHTDKPQDGVSWWQSVPELSLALIDRARIEPSMPVIDVGAGWSTLVDHLLALGYSDLTAIDLSAMALATVRDRLGEPGAQVTLEVADVLDLHLGRTYALWHDRAAFHFLVERDERDEYRTSLLRHVDPGGWLVVATFGPQGPPTCSGLPVVRYSQSELAAEFAPHFEVVAASHDDHTTPWGSTQQFTALLMRRVN